MCCHIQLRVCDPESDAACEEQTDIHDERDWLGALLPMLAQVDREPRCVMHVLVGDSPSVQIVARNTHHDELAQEGSSHEYTGDRVHQRAERDA